MEAIRVVTGGVLLSRSQVRNNIIDQSANNGRWFFWRVINIQEGVLFQEEKDSYKDFRSCVLIGLNNL